MRGCELEDWQRIPLCCVPRHSGLQALQLQRHGNERQVHRGALSDSYLPMRSRCRKLTLGGATTTGSRQQFCETGDRELFPELNIPRSTIRSWVDRGARDVDTCEFFARDRADPLAEIRQYRHRTALLGAIVGARIFQLSRSTTWSRSNCLASTRCAPRARRDATESRRHCDNEAVLRPRPNLPRDSSSYFLVGSVAHGLGCFGACHSMAIIHDAEPRKDTS